MVLSATVLPVHFYSREFCGAQEQTQIAGLVQVAGYLLWIGYLVKLAGKLAANQEMILAQVLHEAVTETAIIKSQLLC